MNDVTMKGLNNELRDIASEIKRIRRGLSTMEGLCDFGSSNGSGIASAGADLAHELENLGETLAERMQAFARRIGDMANSITAVVLEDSITAVENE